MTYPIPLPGRRVRVDWSTIEKAFGNNAQGVQYYLHRTTGAVARLIGGRSHVRGRIQEDPDCVLIDGISARDQYRWLEAFIATVEDGEFRERLTQSIQGPGSFGRFKSALLDKPEELRRWRAFRKVRVRVTITQWFHAKGLIPVPCGHSSPGVTGASLKTRGVVSVREQLYSAADALPPSDLSALTALAEFLQIGARLV